MYTGLKWPKSTWQTSFIHFRHETSLLRLHGLFGPAYLLEVSKNDDEERCFLLSNYMMWLVVSFIFNYPLEKRPPNSWVQNKVEFIKMNVLQGN